MCTLTSSTAGLRGIVQLFFPPIVYTLSIQCWIFVLEFFDVRFRIQHCWIPVVHPLSIQCWIFVLDFFDGAKNVNCHSASAMPRHKRTICANTNFNYSELFITSSLLTIKSSAKKFSTNTKIFSSAGFHVHHHLMLNIYKCWNKKNPVKVLNIMYTIVIQHCWIVKNSAQLQKYSAVLDFMYTLV